MKFEETLRSEHDVSVASYIAEAEVLTEVMTVLNVNVGSFPISTVVRYLLSSMLSIRS